MADAATIAIPAGVPTTILSDATGTGAGNKFANSASPQGGFHGNLTWQTVVSGVFSALTVTIEGSNDGTNWYTLDTSTQTGGEVRGISFFPVAFLRANVTTFTGGTNVSVLVNVGAV